MAFNTKGNIKFHYQSRVFVLIVAWIFSGKSRYAIACLVLSALHCSAIATVQ